MTVEEQIESLRAAAAAAAAGKGMRRMTRGCLVLAVVCFVAGMLVPSSAYYVIGIFLVVLALSGRQVATHIHRAGLALDSPCQRTAVQLLITIEDWSDSQSFHVIIKSGASIHWKFEFHPQGWKPAAGYLDADAYYLPGIAWPVLLVTAQGIVVPRGTPKRDADILV